MNNDIGTPSTHNEGNALPPPRIFGELTTLTLAAGLPSGGVGSQMALANWDASGLAAAPLRAGILQVAADPLTITF
jgi:hypothetical protein